jgi:hypothetical protein
MDFSATIDLIIKDLKEASDIIDDLKKYPGVPALQVELAKLKCRSAGECIAILKNLNETSSFVEKEPVVQELLIIQPADEITEEPVPVAEVLPPVVKEGEHKKIPVREQEAPILADKFSNVTNTFHDKLGIISNEDDLTVMLKSQPIDSLPDAIGINDKFLFIREIFKGNQIDYVQAISRLDSAENLNDARAVIMSYTGENDESEAVKQLLDLVKRKLPANE